MSGGVEVKSSTIGQGRFCGGAALAQITEAIHARASLPAPARRSLAGFPELDCVRRRLPLSAVAAAERRAREVGVTADQVLIASGLLSEEAYVRALAQHLGVAFEPLDAAARMACPLDDGRLVEAGAAGLLPLATGDGLSLVIAPRGVAARRLCSFLAGPTELRRRLRVTTAERLRNFVHSQAGAALGKRAAFGLALARPELSAAPRAVNWVRGFFVAVAVLAIALAAPGAVVTSVGILLSAVFLTWIALRLFSCVIRPAPVPPLPRRPDDSLPVYTIIVALYREAAAVRQLIGSLDRLDWPLEKLDVKLVLESNDLATRRALDSMRLGRPYEIVIAPDIGPRTKPKALNVALPFALGAFVAVFDAEDRPEPDQLRRAFEAFLSHDERLACAQARLTIDNTGDNWLTRMFTAEYAGLFDVLLPGLAAHRLPLPLGGSSNHFRAAVLRAALGWDAHNVTEDADLGMRLARLGYFSTVIPSTTYEEAPARLSAWLKQRRRWFQGWMQTWIVHMRAPIRLMRELGAAGFATMQLVVAGTALAALVHPLFVLAIAVEFATSTLPSSEGAIGGFLVALYGGTFFCGYLTSVMLGLVGLARRRLLSAAWALLLVPVHWMLLSLAAWQAVFKFVSDPYRWDKTEHGLARTSRMNANAAALTVESRRMSGASVGKAA